MVPTGRVVQIGNHARNDRPDCDGGLRAVETTGLTAARPWTLANQITISKYLGILNCPRFS
jgi:hypothetical protein